MNPSADAPSADFGTTVGSVVAHATRVLKASNVAFGHGTQSAEDEAAWLVLWSLQLPLDCDLNPEAEDSVSRQTVSPEQTAAIDALLLTRIQTRKPAAYLTREAWLQGVPFYVDERAIIPRSLIAELLMDGSADDFLDANTKTVLDLCTGNGSLAVLAAMVFPDVQVTASDISSDALEVAKINIAKHSLQDRITPCLSDGLEKLDGPWDLILCNPPYVNAKSMERLPAEYLAEPELALAGGIDGMDFIRRLLAQCAYKMTRDAVLILEVGNERENFENAFPHLPCFWLETSAGEDQVVLITASAMREQARGSIL